MDKNDYKIGDIINFKNGFDIWIGTDMPILNGEVIRFVEKDAVSIPTLNGIPEYRKKYANPWNCETLLVRVMIGKNRNLPSFYTVPKHRIIT